MKAGLDRKYSIEFRNAAVKQVVDVGREITVVARSLEMSSKTLANWVCRARKGYGLVKRLPTKPVRVVVGIAQWLQCCAWARSIETLAPR